MTELDQWLREEPGRTMTTGVTPDPKHSGKPWYARLRGYGIRDCVAWGHATRAEAEEAAFKKLREEEAREAQLLREAEREEVAAGLLQTEPCA